MAQYDFHELSPADFERLVSDLLNAEYGGHWELFAAGKDHGIDIRRRLANEVRLVQCKHYLRTGLPGLRRDLRAEAKKVRKLRPDRYIFATSLPLTPNNKDEISAIIGSDLLRPSDVLGQDDLNSFLRRHPDVEKRHHKLWLLSTAVMERVLHSDVVTRTEFTLARIRRDIRRYVPTNSFRKALDKLNAQRVAILVGPPGIGKTTLAKMLIYEHLEMGFQPVVIGRTIDDAFRLFERDTEQIFYFDDFLGATFLGDRKATFGHTEAHSIRSLIELVLDNGRTRLVLTTREHILNQALEQSEQINKDTVQHHKFRVRMRDYTVVQRAEILYNHLYYSDLPDSFVDEILRDDFYVEVIKHRKFNPRLVEWLSSAHRLKELLPGDYRHFIRELLNDPSEIWMKAFKTQLSHSGRSLLLTLFTMERSHTIDVIEPFFGGIHSVRANKYRFPRHPDDYPTALRELSGAFVTVDSKNAVSLIDPSVHDLLNAVLKDAPENAIDLIEGARYFRQAAIVWNFGNSLEVGQCHSATRKSQNHSGATSGESD